MRILTKTKNKITTGEKFFGGYLPDEIHEFIALYTESHGISKTDVLKEMANEWLRKTKDESSVSDLMIGIVTRVKKYISAHKLKQTKYFNISEIRDNVYKELLKKGISGDIVEQIILQIKK